MSAVTRNRQTPSITLKSHIIDYIHGTQTDAEALLDSGAEGIVIHPDYAKSHNLAIKELAKPFPVCNVDGTNNVMGYVTGTTTQTIRIYSKDFQSYHEEIAEFFLANIGLFDIILGTDWLEAHNPEI
ncbi:hypothetical protein BV25DRAFT_1817178, partial [Artomyces pyxidatus]